MEDKKLTPKEKLWNFLCVRGYAEYGGLWTAFAILELAEAVRSLKPELPEYLQKILDGQK